MHLEDLGVEAGLGPVPGDRLARDGTDLRAWDQRDDASAEPGAGQPGAGRAVLDEQIDSQVELGCRDGVVVAQAGVAGEHQ